MQLKTLHFLSFQHLRSVKNDLKKFLRSFANAQPSQEVFLSVLDVAREHFHFMQRNLRKRQDGDTKRQGILKGGSITVPLTSCMTGLD